MGKKIMPTTYLLIAILLCVALHFVVPIRTIVPRTWNLLGLIPLAFGVWINLAADRAFQKAGTTVKPFEESTALIQDGTFRLSRNPMYLGFAAIMVGISILLRSASPTIVVILFVVLMDRVYIRVEEEMLAAEFEQAWIDYRSRVRRWI